MGIEGIWNGLKVHHGQVSLLTIELEQVDAQNG